MILMSEKMTSQTIQMNSFTFLFNATKETHEQRKTKIAYLFIGERNTRYIKYLPVRSSRSPKKS